MKTRFSSIVLREVAEVVAGNKPAIATEHGDLFLLTARSMTAIRLKNNLTFSDYLNFVQSLNEAVRPKLTWMVDIAGKDFQIVMMANIEVRDGKTFVDGREVVFL